MGGGGAGSLGELCSQPLESAAFSKGSNLDLGQPVRVGGIFGWYGKPPPPPHLPPTGKWGSGPLDMPKLPAQGSDLMDVGEEDLGKIPWVVDDNV